MKESQYKLKIKEIIGSDIEIAKAIINKDNYFQDETPSRIKIVNMKKKNIFEYNKVPDLNVEDEVYITMGFSFDYSKFSKLPLVTISIFIYVHNNLIQTAYELNRLDFIKERIFDLLNGNQTLEASELRIIGSNDKPPVTSDYAVTSISFTSISISG